MRMNMAQGTEVHFPGGPRAAGSKFFKTMHTIQVFEDRPMSVWQFQCCNLRLNARNRH